ncbi:uncharacterized protein TNCV_817951 [Trichonephila clavipes]|nr:uncharacterized protein TNCV_817951 [Trichonephila clavipes]
MHVYRFQYGKNVGKSLAGGVIDGSTYASTKKFAGEVIPRKISTEWMANMRIVSDVLSKKEADDAFKLAAGQKITMNIQEYREFLFSLSARKKLPLYEIYRRMCGLQGTFFS